jgi:hypothetical protein
MQPFNERSSRSARRLVVVAVVAVWFVTGTARSQQREGIAAGPFILTPWIESDIETDSNLFNAPDTFGQDDAEVSASLGFGFEAILPFSHSLLEFRYNGAQISYESAALASDVASRGDLGLTLVFSSGNTFYFRDAFLRDFVQVPDTDIPEQGPGVTPEEKYFGSPYHYNRLDIGVRRDEPRSQGYQVRIGRRDFVYQDGTFGGQYDFRGWDNDFEYYRPLTSNRRIVVHYRMQRYEHFRALEGVGVPFREEISDTLQAGLSGVGSVRPFFFRVGYARFLYESKDPLETRSNFRGVSGFARWNLPLGGRSSLSMLLSRRPLPSSYPTYYISNQFRSVAERGFRPDVKLGLILGISNNRYADEIIFRNCDDVGAPSECQPSRLVCDGLRNDVTWDAGFRASWEVHNMFELNLTGKHEKRNSNCENSDYNSDSINLGFKVGWY